MTVRDWMVMFGFAFTFLQRKDKFEPLISQQGFILRTSQIEFELI
jgi:hypothetical protein